jgi:hypothetical protein
MLKHPAKTELKAYADRTLTADELLRIDEHLSNCDECFSNMQQHLNSDPTAASFADVLTAVGPDDGHLSYEQLAGYVDRTLGGVENEIVEVHSGGCELCSLQLDDLRQIKAGIRSQTPLQTSRPGFWEQITNAISIKWAAPVLAALLLAFAGLMWYGTSNKPVEEVRVIDQQNRNADQEIRLPEATPDLPANAETSTNEPLHHVTASLVDAGGKIELDENGNVTGINAGRFAQTIKSALAGQDIPISTDARNLRSSAGVLMGGSNDGVPFKVSGPVGKIVVSDRPQFTWGSVDGADSYTVSIYDDNYSKVATSPPLKQPAWTPGTPLRRGAFYKWQVTALKNGEEIKSPVRPAPDARFKVLDVSAASDIETAKRQAGTSHLLLGIVYAKAGLIAEAEREFQALLKQNPNSELAKRLLNKVKAAK